MTFEYFLLLLTVLSTITSLFTEGIKAFLNELHIKYSSNIVVLISAVLVGGVGTALFYVFNGYAWTTINIICLVLMIVANWLGAMIGYDKVIQTITQIKSH